LALFVFGVLGSVLIMVILQGAWWVAVFVGMVLAFIVHAFATTYYVIAPTKLTVRCGFLYNVVIPIDQIISVRSSRDLTSAPALSLRRLSVRHKRGEVLISPVHPHLFIQALLDRGAIIGD
jgi:predicted signal transduction protein with EAL and GGDEF domain